VKGVQIDTLFVNDFFGRVGCAQGMMRSVRRVSEIECSSERAGARVGFSRNVFGVGSMISSISSTLSSLGAAAGLCAFLPVTCLQRLQTRAKVTAFLSDHPAGEKVESHVVVQQVAKRLDGGGLQLPVRRGLAASFCSAFVCSRMPFEVIQSPTRYGLLLLR
jgi:hypothetical protein